MRRHRGRSRAGGLLALRRTQLPAAAAVNRFPPAHDGLGGRRKHDPALPGGRLPLRPRRGSDDHPRPARQAVAAAGLAGRLRPRRDVRADATAAVRRRAAGPGDRSGARLARGADRRRPATSLRHGNGDCRLAFGPRTADRQTQGDQARLGRVHGARRPLQCAWRVLGDHRLRIHHRVCQQPAPQRPVPRRFYPGEPDPPLLSVRQQEARGPVGPSRRVRGAGRWRGAGHRPRRQPVERPDVFAERL